MPIIWLHDYSTISHLSIVISTGGTIGRACRIILYASISATHIIFISWGTPSHSRMNWLIFDWHRSRCRMHRRSVIRMKRRQWIKSRRYADIYFALYVLTTALALRELVWIVHRPSTTMLKIGRLLTMSDILLNSPSRSLECWFSSICNNALIVIKRQYNREIQRGQEYMRKMQYVKKIRWAHISIDSTLSSISLVIRYRTPAWFVILFPHGFSSLALSL